MERRDVVTTMKVYLVPVGGERYEPYYEAPPDAEADAPADPNPGWFRRKWDGLRASLAEAERERDRESKGGAGSRGLWAFLLRKIAEGIAEQRLLWHLRSADRGQLWFPDRIESSRALSIFHAGLVADAVKHRRWLVIDALLALACVPLTLIPGPNVPALYFTFRAVGHFFSLRGALRGRSRVSWALQPSDQLTALEGVLRAGGPDRVARLSAIADALGLSRLDDFAARVARPAA